MLCLATITHLSPSLNPQTLFLSSADSVDLLNSCAARRDLKLTISLHAAIAKSGLLSANLVVANSLLDSYSKCGQLSHARKLFDQMPDRDIISWTSLISGYCRNGLPKVALSICFDLLLCEDSPAPNEFTVAAVLKACALLCDERMGQALHGYIITNGFSGDAFVSNSLIDMYTKLGMITSAETLLGGLTCRDVVSWSAIISGYVLDEMFERALVLFLMMIEDGVEPNLVTLLSIIRACSLMSDLRNFGCVHAWVLKLGLAADALAVNSLIEMYSKNGLVEEGLKVMVQACVSNGISCLDPDTMAALIHGCTISGSFAHGRELHGLLIKFGFVPTTIVENSLMDMYAKNGHVASAHSIFQRMVNKDTVSWNTLISCLAKNDGASEVLEHLAELLRGDLAPDSISILCSIKACSEIASLQHGQTLHGYSIKSGFNAHVFVCNALIDMYAKSGRIAFAEQVFDEMDHKDLGSWNSMFQAYGIHGDGCSALRVFNQLKELRQHTPNAITFVSIISACSHSGLINEGYECYESMRREYAIEPTMEHYASVVDLLGRTGKLEEAENFIKDMPVEPGSAVWGTLLGACGVFGDVEVAERAAAKLAVLEPDGSAWRVALSNVYAVAGRWVDVGRLRAATKGEGARKEAGWSSVEVNGRGRFRFIVGDTRHPESERIYQVWNSIKEHSLDAC